jgi:hypothetical protein
VRPCLGTIKEHLIMTNKTPPKKTDLAGVILGLFKQEDEVVLLTPGLDLDDQPNEELIGLRLAADCLVEGYREALLEPGGLYADGAREKYDVTDKHPRLKPIKKALRKLARREQTDDWFVVCYRLEGSAESHVAWSQRLSEFTAFNVVLAFIQTLTATVVYLEEEDSLPSLVPADCPFPLMR